MMSVYDCGSRLDVAVSAAAQAVRRGELVVLPTDTVYGVGADAFCAAAVNRLLTVKGRGREKPSPVLVASQADAERLAVISQEARMLMRLWPGALTIVLPARPEIGWDLGETGGTVALRMPADHVALTLLEETGPLAVSSANITGQPSALTVQEAREQLGNAVAVYLDSGPCSGGTPSTIIDGRDLTILRHGAIPDDAIVTAM
ncbi:threonylcarbamoyl-AMP synthase [Actinobaculum sp. 352]|nr:threonylcarbamoyl-AMP synthase [Actinobaculum sp. 313]RTE49090.1 threonylcarbamoyl-AMP synthase [Actinobaculum sp. 352]